MGHAGLRERLCPRVLLGEPGHAGPGPVEIARDEGPTNLGRLHEVLRHQALTGRNLLGRRPLGLGSLGFGSGGLGRVGGLLATRAEGEGEGQGEG